MSTSDLSDFSMLDLFAVEVENHAAVLNEGLLSLESDASNAAALERLMRSAHSIKGAARIININAAVKVAHAMEEAFVSAQKGRIVAGPAWIDALLAGVDLLCRISKTPEDQLASWEREDGGEIQPFLARLAAVEASAAAPTPHTAGDLATVPDAPQPTQAPTALPPVEAGIAPSAERAKMSATPFATSLNQGASESSSEGTVGGDRVIRISAENLNRLLGMCGESLVESRWLHPFGASLLRLKRLQQQAGKSFSAFQDALCGLPLDDRCRSLAIQAQSQLDECRSFLAERLVELDLYDRRAGNLSQRLYQQVVSCRMRPFSDGAKGFPRMMRDLARTLGKQIKFSIAGEATQVDRDVLEKLEAPLTHLLRNAVDHGVEMPEDRRKAGKSEQAVVRLEARHGAGMLHITVSDDGRGVDYAKLREVVVRRNLVTEEMAARMSEPELIDFLFLPGFSTKESVTEVSGRGVGLDVVQVMVRQLRGSLRAESKPGQGMRFHLQLPLTLSVSRMLLVEICGEPYAIPLAHLYRTLRISPSELGMSQGRQHFLFDGARIGLVGADQVLGLPSRSVGEGHWSVVVVGDRSVRYGLVVDRFIEERELVVQPLDIRLGKVRDVSAGALMPDGSPVLVLDVEDVVRSIELLLDGGRLEKVRVADELVAGSVRRKRVLVVDDSLIVREVQRKLLQTRGYEVEVAVDGADGLHAARSGGFDLVITDVDMPRMTGIELLNSIKQDPKLSAMPVMIVSYKDREEDRRQGLLAGANFYLTKGSFHDDSLLEAVEDLIGEAA